MKVNLLTIEIIFLIVSLALLIASLYIFQKDSCGQPEPYGVGMRLYCKEAGFPIKILSGGPALVGFGGTVLWGVDKSVAYIGNFGFYILTLNLGYLMFNRARKLLNK